MSCNERKSIQEKADDFARRLAGDRGADMRPEHHHEHWNAEDEDDNGNQHEGSEYYIDPAESESKTAHKPGGIHLGSPKKP